MKIACLSTALLATSAAAFAPQTTKSSVTLSKTSLSAIDGWSPDPSKFAYGLPGVVPPFAEGFDPLNLADKDLQDVLYFREAETQHGRVAMLAVLGFLVQENPINFHPLFESKAVALGPAIYHLDQVRAVAPPFFTLLAALIGFAELNRALRGWEAPPEGAWTLQEE